jgi:tripartite-type tricarboxylate transporter receptor subunit TctC
MHGIHRIARLSLYLMLMVLATVSVAVAAPYQGKDRINLVIGYEAGGGYDVYGRFVARFLGAHVGGEPQVIPQNMPGAGSLRAANYIYNIAPKDGTAIGTVSQSIPMMQLLGTPGILFDTDKFSWIGRISDVDTILGVWTAAGVSTVEDLKRKPIAVAVGGALSGSELYVLFLNKLVGTKIQSVAGYSGKTAQLAMERGEIDGSFSLLLNQSKVQNPHWFTEGKLKVLVQIGTERRPAIADVPTLTELGTSDEDRKILAAVSAGDILGRSFLGPPGMDADRFAQLRSGFAAMLHDPVVIAAAEKQKLDLNFLDGEATYALVHQYQALSPAVVERIKAVVAEADSKRK